MVNLYVVIVIVRNEKIAWNKFCGRGHGGKYSSDIQYKIIASNFRILN